MPTSYYVCTSSASGKCTASGCKARIEHDEARLAIVSSAGASSYRHLACVTATLTKNVLKSLDDDLDALVGLDRLRAADKARVKACFCGVSAGKESAPRKKKVKRTEDWVDSSSEEEVEAVDARAAAPAHGAGLAARVAPRPVKKKAASKKSKTPVTTGAVF